jgi:hypothetical protein
MRVQTKFTASEADGNEHTIRVLRGEHEAIDPDGHRIMVPDALGRMWTDDGEFVSFVNHGVYDLIDGTKTIRVTSSDPKAP